MTSRIYREKRDFKILGTVGVCATTREGLVKKIFSIPVNPVSATVVLVGIPAVVSAKENPQIEKMYNNATIAAIDGMPVVKMGRRIGLACERCAAPDIMGLIFEESIIRKKTHFFYGGKNDTVLQKLCDNLTQKYPGLQIVGKYVPPFRSLTEEEDEYICKKINDLRPDFVWVGIGAPKQELWMQEHQKKIKETVMIGVGAGFDFYAGTLAKAPIWIEKAGFEWLFRLLKEPRRLWKRYLLGGIKYIYYSFEIFTKKQEESDK